LPTLWRLSFIWTYKSHMLRIRLQRTGNRNNPTYRIVVADKRNAAKGKFNEIVGHYLPTRNPAEFEYNKERIEYWISQGAAPTDTMARLLSKSGMKGLEKFTESYSKKKKRNPSEEEIAAANPPPPPPPAAEPAPVEEAKPEEAPAIEEAPKAEEPAPVEEKKEETSPEVESKEEPASDEAPADKDDKEDK